MACSSYATIALMGIIGGEIGYRILKTLYPGGLNVPMSQGNPYKDKGQSKLGVLFGPEIFAELADKTVLDFGCGDGENCIELAERGVKSVIGLDIQESRLCLAREEAARRGVADKCEFVAGTNRKVDVVLSTDAFEHFDDPAAILTEMASLLKPSGFALIEFGYTWLHPYGGHLFSVFPWAHLVFTEKSLIRWRSDFKTDGATKFGEVAGGLNQMTIHRWERLVRESPLDFLSYRLKPIGAVKSVHSRLTRELFTSVILARLRLKSAKT
jgi:SAM-dependent methyltransferase